MVLDLYHSCSVTQPLLLDWLHSHGCPVSEGKLNDLLIHGHEQFHQEREDILETAIACSRMLLVDDTGARHDGKNGFCTAISNDTFTEAAWNAFLDDHKMFAKEQRRGATEAVLKAGLLNNGFPEAMIIHSDGARQFDTAFEHSLCWFHGSRPLAKLVPANKKERAARDWIEKQYWHLYDDIEAYCQAPTAAWKEQIRQDFNHWVTTMVDYPDLRYELGKLHRAREELLLVLKHPWLPLHNNLSERQIREYVKRRKISGGTRSVLGQRCRDTFASLKKTCRLNGLSFSRYLKDRISGAGVISRLSDISTRPYGIEYFWLIDQVPCKAQRREHS